LRPRLASTGNYWICGGERWVGVESDVVERHANTVAALTDGVQDDLGRGLGNDTACVQRRTDVHGLIDILEEEIRVRLNDCIVVHVVSVPAGSHDDGDVESKVVHFTHTGGDVLAQLDRAIASRAVH